ncbi:acylphosphatase [Lysobacter enzymogenes]|uniref:acylphosphatase n=1 Tax=Lysobacter enzymogenes TaxID=69 RepID=A0AAU9AM71_LYSEN|nr:acylphosphatase [Lysobacter enzymogenes]BAV96804.1 acylphosphatase [Lysobacter enzymogenes]
MSAARFYVSGKVQGVWFRAGAREQAVALDLRGYANNLRDGRVEVLAVGEDAAIERLAQWLGHGTANARVDRLEREPAAEAEAGDGFICG